MWAAGALPAELLNVQPGVRRVHTVRRPPLLLRLLPPPLRPQRRSLHGALFNNLLDTLCILSFNVLNLKPVDCG